MRLVPLVFAAAISGASCQSTTETRLASTSTVAKETRAPTAATPVANVAGSPTDRFAATVPVLAGAQPLVIGASTTDSTGTEYIWTGGVTGDLDGDGDLDAVVTVEAFPGGTSVSTLLAVVRNNDGKPAFVETYATGGVHDLGIRDGQIVYTEPVFGPDDPHCCPSLAERVVLALRGDSIAVVSRVNVKRPEQ